MLPQFVFACLMNGQEKAGSGSPNISSTHQALSVAQPHPSCSGPAQQALLITIYTPWS